MKYLEISQLRSKKETPAKILEDNLCVTNKNILTLKNDIALFIDDMQKLREGLCYKQEEMQKEICNKTPAKIIADFDEFEQRIAKIDSYEIAQIRNILNEHKEIERLKTDMRIVSILSELKKNNFAAIEKLVANKDEWLFFSKVLEIDFDLHSTIRKYKHDMEDAIFASLQPMLQTKDYAGVRNSYNALKHINKHKPLADAYIKSLSIDDLHKKEKQKYETVDLDLYMNEHNSFVKYLNEIEKLYSKTIEEIKKMFDKPEKIIQKLDKCIFEEILVQHLDFCIEQNEPGLYLLNLEYFAKNTKTMLQNIQAANENMNTKETYSKMYKVYMTEMQHKEKECFDYFFDIIVKKKATKHKYTYKNTQLLVKDFAPFDEVANMVKVASMIARRAKTLEYSTELTDALYGHVFRKLCQYADFVCMSFQGTDKFELVKTITDIYLLVKNYLSTFASFADFQAHINQIVQANIEIKTKEAELHTKHIVKTLNYRDVVKDNTKMMTQLLTYLKHEQQNVEMNMKGKNGTKYIANLLSFLYHRLHKQYFGVVYNKNDSFFALNDLRVMLRFVKENKFVEVYGLFEHLAEVIEFVTVQKNDVLLYYKAMTNKIPENELKQILKCRSDYKDVKKLFY